jgi:hypothetical protein
MARPQRLISLSRDPHLSVLHRVAGTPGGKLGTSYFGDSALFIGASAIKSALSPK